VSHSYHFELKKRLAGFFPFYSRVYDECAILLAFSLGPRGKTVADSAGAAPKLRVQVTNGVPQVYEAPLCRDSEKIMP
jgi:hypothetical protein